MPSRPKQTIHNSPAFVLFLRFLSVCLAATVPAWPAFAHHSAFNQFDKGSIIDVEGTITRVEWRNPHASIYVATRNAAGEPVEWRLEAGGSTQLVRVGIQRELLVVGEPLRAAGWPPITDKKEMFITNLLLSNGKEYLTHRNAKPRWRQHAVGDQSYQLQTTGDGSRPELGMFRVWSHTDVSPWLIPEDFDRSYDLSTYPLTAAARAALQAFDRIRDNPTRNCRAKGMPTIMEQPYPMAIVRDGDNIRLHLEEYDTERVIHMNEREIPTDAPYSHLGYSIGRWEGKVLHVTTAKIDWGWLDQAGISLSHDTVLSEQFVAADDGSRLDYQLTITDPVNFTEPVQLQKYWIYIPGRDVLPYECTPD